MNGIAENGRRYVRLLLHACLVPGVLSGCGSERVANTKTDTFFTDTVVRRFESPRFVSDN